MDIEIFWDKRVDAINWIKSYTSSSFNGGWKKMLPKGCDLFFNRLDFSDEELLMGAVTAFLEEKYKLQDIQQNMDFVYRLYLQHMDYIILRLESLTHYPMFHKKITLWATTFPRCPYNRRDGEIWTYILQKESKLLLRNLIHELLHFQFHQYYDKGHVSFLTKEKFEILKESLTFLVNCEFQNLDLAYDHGYLQHKVIRDKLERFWFYLPEKSFHSLVEYGCSLLSD